MQTPLSKSVSPISLPPSQAGSSRSTTGMWRASSATARSAVCENISSIEVEDVLYRHPDVMEAAVVARPDEKWGETPCAFVSLKEGAAVTEAEILTFCKGQLAGFKTPKTVVFGSLPRTQTGKVQKFVLRATAREL